MIKALRNSFNKAKNVLKEKTSGISTSLSGTVNHFKSVYQQATQAPTLIPYEPRPVTPRNIMPGSKGMREDTLPMANQDVLAMLLCDLHTTTDPRMIEGIRRSLNGQTIRMLGISRDYRMEDNKNNLEQKGYICIRHDDPLYAAASFVYDGETHQQDLWVHEQTLPHLKQYHPRHAGAKHTIQYYINRLADQNIVPILHLDEMMSMLGRYPEEVLAPSTETGLPSTRPSHIPHSLAARP